jgi:hypothetical protein
MNLYIHQLQSILQGQCKIIERENRQNGNQESRQKGTREEGSKESSKEGCKEEVAVGPT